MATRAVYSFSGFPCAPVRHLYLHHDGYPAGAAWRFAMALSEGGEASFFLAAFQGTQPKAEPLASPEQAADAEYRYRIRLVGGAEPHLRVECWRRLPGGTSWHPRCGADDPAGVHPAFSPRWIPTMNTSPISKGDLALAKGS